ncbi:hypothetical protein [Ekhidna sp.]
MNKISISFILLFSGLYATAQPQGNRSYPDTLILKTDSQIEMTFAFFEMRNHKEYMKNDLWKSILGAMESAVQSSTRDEGIEVSYMKVKQQEEEVAKIEITPLLNTADVFIIENNGMKELLSDRIQFTIYQREISISFSVNDLSELEQIKEINIETVWDQVEQKYKNQGRRNLYTGKGIIKYGNANIDQIASRSEGNDAIELSMGIGMGYYRDRFIPDLGFKLGFNFPDRFGNIKVQTGLLYTQQYLFFGSEEIATSEPDVNGFLTGFFTLQYGSGGKFGGGNKVGVGLGYLIHSEGDFYEGHTFKMSLFTQKSDSRINFTPELIFTNSFKQAFPALRFGLSF